MPIAKKKTLRTSRKTARPKQKRAGTVRKATGARRPGEPKAPRRPAHRAGDDTTFVYECTESGCGYRIWREDGDEPGHLRFDLKCPKCHHKAFRCLGKGDVPETFEAPPQPAQLDFDTMKPADIGSN